MYLTDRERACSGLPKGETECKADPKDKKRVNRTTYSSVTNSLLQVWTMKYRHKCNY
jgi:hypothetical protein